ncbi:MAG TPA: D-arabinitol 4-dehydrogenase [Caldimonas sp.]|jgi:D-arabinitol 4-dehydrogenase|nr:D-arabinitol 4-dehydrogenase [Caldimonas sp.]HEV7577625.1 D-arabinitol 4-dehydrogenase [Caldimonas sp.]
MGAAPPDGSGPTLLHLGLGSFHRAHQAVYLHRLRESGDRSWSIVAGNIRADMEATAAALAAQGGAYTLETVSPGGERRYERITSIREVVAFEPTLARLLEVGAAASTRIVSFTVTEAGYYLDAANRLDLAHADLRADLDGRACATIYGAVAAILRERMRRGGGAVTLLNCDNLRSNGARFRAGLLDFLARRGETALSAWVEAYTSCPCAMVDRITPRPGPDVADRVKAATGIDDLAPVMAESFIQWVVEDDFIAGRPAWERVGVEMVTSVHAHEEAKIRVLNASHSCVAWAGTLRGLSFIHEDVAVPAIRRMAWDYVTDDVIPCLDSPAQPAPIDLAAYRDVVLERFGNPFVRDRNQRVAMDGFSKIPGFIVPTLRDCIAAGRPIASTAMLPALFFAFLGRWHRGELADGYQDGVMDAASAHAFFTAADPLLAFCRDPSLWQELAGNESLLAALREAQRRVDAFVRA